MSADVQDALAQVGRALRIAASQDADRAWWDKHRARMAANHLDLYLQSASLLHHVDTGVTVGTGLRDRMLAALTEYDAIRAALSQRVHGRDE